jgi:hypothetical protein
MSLSTPIDALASPNPANGQPADEERVRRILAEMNAEAVVQPPPGVSAEGQARVITEPPISMSTGQLRMDPGTARANVIGNSTPTMADFHAMFQQASPGMAPFQPHRTPAAEELHVPASEKTTWRQTMAQALRAPFAVAVIVFLLNLPVVTALLSRYATWMYLGSGEISVGGILVKALLSAILFAVYQGVAMVWDK